MNAGKLGFHGGGNVGRGGGQACASCKFQRRKCGPGCILAPFFPPEYAEQFMNAHRLFGVSNLVKLIKDLDHNQRVDAMKSIIFQANARVADPVGGCTRIISRLRYEIAKTRAELEFVIEQIQMFRERDGGEPSTGAIIPFNHFDHQGFHSGGGGGGGGYYPAMGQQQQLLIAGPSNVEVMSWHNYNSDQQLQNPGSWVQQQQNLGGWDCSSSKQPLIEPVSNSDGSNPESTDMIDDRQDPLSDSKDPVDSSNQQLQNQGSWVQQQHILSGQDCTSQKQPLIERVTIFDNSNPESMDMFDDQQAPLSDSKDPFDSSANPSGKEEMSSIEHVQEHDLKGAASFFTLRDFK